NALQTLVNSRTTQYHTLNDQFATYFAGRSQAFPTSYDPSFQYVAATSETSQLTAGIKVWTEDELLHLVGAGLLKSVTDTVATVEDPNIVATDVTLLVANGNVGRTSGQVPIPIDSRPGPGLPGHDFSDAELVAMGAAERKDVAYLS